MSADLTPEEREALRFLVNNRSAFNFEQAVAAVEKIVATRVQQAEAERGMLREGRDHMEAAADEWQDRAEAAEQRLAAVEALVGEYDADPVGGLSYGESREALVAALADPGPVLDRVKAEVWDECLTHVTRTAQVGSAGLNDECYDNPYRAERAGGE